MSQTRECADKGKRAATRGGAALYRLILLFPSFFPAAFARQCFLHALLLARLQIKGVALNLLDYVLLLHLALETAQCILKGLALLQSDFCQWNYTPKLVQWDCIVIARFCAQVKFYVRCGLSTRRISTSLSQIVSLRVIEPIVQPSSRRSVHSPAGRGSRGSHFDLTTVAISGEVAVISPVIVMSYVTGAPRVAVFET
jgi:hypothetical protein